MRPISFYWRLIRPHTLAASFIPVLCGLSFSLMQHVKFHPFLALDMLACAVLIQIATNLFNEYYDYKNGVDDENSVGIGGAIVNDGVEPAYILMGALGIFAVCGILGLVLAWQTSWWLIVIGACGMMIAFLYTGGPLPISSTPFGELFAGTLMGMVYFLITFFTQSGKVTGLAVATSIPLVILIGLLLTCNSLRDRIPDMESGRHTLAILLGHEGTIKFMAAGFALAYIWLIVLIPVGHNAFILLPMITAPLAARCLQAYRTAGQSPQKMMRGMLYCSKVNKYFGLCLALAMLIEAIV